jgi:hypothetical protein
LPVHFRVTRGEGLRIDENEAHEFAGFASAITSVEHTHDFIVIDTPGAESYLTRLAHSMADTLITPLNDSFVDFDVLGTIDPETFALTGPSHYSEMVREARRQRRIVDGGRTDWVVVRNRLSMLDSRDKRLVGAGLDQLAGRLGFRFIDGFAERVVYRELFPRGLTALDPIDEATRRAAEPCARDGAGGGAGAALRAAPAGRRARPPPRHDARGVVRQRRPGARDGRHPGGLTRRSGALAILRFAVQAGASEPVAVLMHAGGTARVALALRVLREDVDELLAVCPGLLMGQMRCKCRTSNRKRHRNRQRDDDTERLEFQHPGLPL